MYMQAAIDKQMTELEDMGAPGLRNCRYRKAQFTYNHTHTHTRARARAYSLSHTQGFQDVRPNKVKECNLNSGGGGKFRGDYRSLS